MIAAAILAFGFVYLHPFVDGNGRIHRYLIHHVLAGRGFNPAGVVFPVSSAILERIDAYRAALDDYSKRLLPVIDWDATADGNVHVRSDTADFYRFFDATPHAEFLYECVHAMLFELLVFCLFEYGLPALRDELHMAVVREFRKHGITISFPQLDVHLNPGQTPGVNPASDK